MSETPTEAVAGEAEAELVLVPPRGLVPVLLLALLTVAAVGVRWPFAVQGDARPDLLLESWRADAATYWQQLQTDAELAGPAPDEEPVRGEMVAWLGREATLGAAAVDDPEARRLRGSAEESLRRLALKGGNRAVVTFARRYGRDVAIAAGAALAAGRAAGRPIEGLEVDAPEAKALRAVAPGVDSLLDRARFGQELRPDGGLDPAAAGVLAMMAESRALAMAVRVPPPRPEPGSRARRTVLAFRVERGQGLSMERRLDLLDDLMQLDPAYPRSFATGVILAQGRSYRAARAAFLAAATIGERPDAARANARYCKRRLAASGAAGDG